MGICLSPKKLFLGYPSVQLLRQHVDTLGLSTTDDKLKVISSLTFPHMLQQLETYLGMTRYLQQYIPHYTAIVKPLQLCKTCLTCKIPSNRGACKHAAGAAVVSLPMPKELNAFHHLQSLFTRPSMLAHFDPARQLWIDLDALKEFGFGAHVYHDKMDQSRDTPPPQKSLNSILFLSCLLTDTETRYWPTELEVAGLVWVVKKVQHMIETTKQPSMIIYMDHAATVSIIQQTSLNTTSVEKLNLCLICVSEYLQHFQLDVHYHPGKSNVVPDALSHLANQEITPNTETTLDVLHSTTLVEMSASF